ncbi:DUF262 domain-containing protein [Mesorhizobium sp.]|uniref:DUF262 domain-containing protein n=1 Tax=Mesorhizobium sp. TaxID=1871066 RepID=UPI00257B5720|nr:DUF262 domain-containing protein [Mesorhizobium sp.]
MSDRLEECFRTLKNALMVVIIDLQTSDDPQVIFETLNARGEPLLPADLLRNYIFLRATRDGDDAEALYRNYWQRFDEEFWRQEVKQGRLTRPRSDLFMQHFLASKQGQDIPIKHLYVEYRHWVERVRPFENVEEELATLSRQRDHFRRILEPNDGDPLFDLAVFMDAYDIRTGYPFLLSLLEAEVANEEWLAISDVLQSYLLRRAVCALGTKNYNKIFLSLTRNLRRDGFTAVNVRNQLLAQTGDSSEWPDDTRFRESWLNAPIYNQQGNSRLVYLLSRLNETFASSKAEGLTFSAQPTIEHILPQSWQEHWPLVDGSKGLDLYELFQAEEGDTRASMTRSRNAKIQTIGNLTILSSGLNTAQSNLSWSDKLPELMRHSLLPINQALQGLVTWDETSIEARGRLLFDRALTIWTR